MERFDQLLEDYFDGALSDAELDEFAGLMRETPSLRSRFVAQAEMAGLLANQFASDDATQIVNRTLVALPDKPGGGELTTDAIMKLIADVPRPVPTPTEARLHAENHWRLWTLAAAVILVLGALALRFIAFNSQSLASIATLHSSGSVHIISSMTGDERDAQGKDELLQSVDGIQLGPNGHATITFWDETTLELRGDSAKMWLSNRQNPIGRRAAVHTPDLGKHIVLEFGTLSVKAAKQPANAPMLVLTPHADAEVVGTQFLLAVTAQSTHLDVSEGRVKFTRATDSASVLVDAQHYTTSDTTGELKALPAP
jgi:hypothetical protein